VHQQRGGRRNSIRQLPHCNSVALQRLGLQYPDRGSDPIQRLRALTGFCLCLPAGVVRGARWVHFEVANKAN
jgi:hypothetical protein